MTDEEIVALIYCVYGIFMHNVMKNTHILILALATFRYISMY